MKNTFTKYYAFIPSIIVVLFSLYYYMNFWNIEKSIAWDGLGYYLYLPATFLNDDILIKDYNMYWSIIQEYDLSTSFYQVSKSPTNNWMMKYTMGKAVTMSPFYFVSDWVAILFDYKRDGFSMPYQVGVFISGLFYLLVGGLVFTKVLLKLFAKKIAFILMTIFFFGTNMFAISTMGIAKVHVVLFALYSLLLWFTIKWHETKSTKHLVYLAGIFGLMILTRPTEGIAILIPLLWGVKSWPEFKERIQLIKALKYQFFIGLLLVILIIFPQLIYWQIIGGQWLITDYGNPAEGFDWFTPHILDALFSYRKGWFLYTPIMLLGMLGFYWMYKNKREFFWPIFLFTVINIYVVSSWSCWWYATSFSNRGFSHSSLVLILPLGFMFKSFFQSKGKIVLFGLTGLFFLLNQFQSWQASNWILHGSRMSKEYYWKIFGKTSVSEEDRKYLRPDLETNDIPPMDELVLKKTLGYDFDNPEHNIEFAKQAAFSGDAGAFINDNVDFSESIQIKFDEITKGDYAWLEIKGKIKPTEDLKSSPFSLITTFSHGKSNYKYQGLDSEKVDWKIGEWNEFSIIYLTPDVRSRKDKISIYLWNRGKQFVAMDELEINIYEKR